MKGINMRVLAILGLVLCAAIGAIIWSMQATVPEQRPDRLAAFGGNFTLPGTTGKPVSLADYRGRVVLLNFGFTHCPDICPMTLSRMKQVLRDLGPAADQVQPVFVTFDPERDDLLRLKEYLAFFDPRFVGLRGDEAQTREVTALFKVIYSREESESGAGYGFSHSDFIYLIDRQGKVVELFGQETPVGTMVDRVRSELQD